MKTFENWESEELELTFGLQRVKNSLSLGQWLKAKCIITDIENLRIDILRSELSDNADYWNEDELKFFFISPLIAFVNFTSEKFKPFTQRPLATMKTDVNGSEVELKGRVEFIVATGKQHPRHPFFFLHEYKPEKRRDKDPLGQVLSAMLASRELNTTKHALYGCYVVGRMWFFVLLQNNEYSVSQAYDATKKDDLSAIFCILKECKKYVEALVG